MRHPSILNDEEIAWYAENRGMITPFVPKQVTTTEVVAGQGGVQAISYGLTSFGYDLRLSSEDFRVFKSWHYDGTPLVDPKNFDEHLLRPAGLQLSDNGTYFILPAHSYGLGVAVEKLKLPDDVVAVCVGKSTYARCGIIANVTPAEPGWEGHLTLEFSNSSSADCKLYTDEGVVQMIFFRGSPCETSYAQRNGKYQMQPETVTLPRIL